MVLYHVIRTQIKLLYYETFKKSHCHDVYDDQAQTH
jgi:hypothetical protein